MKVIHLFLAVLFVSTLTHGQYKLSKKEINWGEDLKASKKSTLSDLMAGSDGDFFAIKYQRKGFYGMGSFFILEHFDKNMKFLKANEIEIMFEKKELDMEFIVFYGTELLVFSSFSNVKLKKNFLFVQTVNQNTLELNNDLKKVAEISFENKTKYNNGYFGFEVSRDESTMLIYYKLPYEGKSNEKYGIHVYDVNMNELWHKQVVLPYSDKLFEVQDYKVSNNKDVYILGKLYEEKVKESRKGEPNYTYKVIAYKDQGNLSVSSTIEITDKYIYELNIAINDNDQIIGTGFYSDGGSGVKGIFFTRVSKITGEIEKQSYKEFGIDFIKQNLTVKQEKKIDKKIKKGNNVEMYQYDLDNIVFKEDGGVVIVGEQYYVRSSTYTTYSQNGGSHTYTTYHYYYNDVIVSSISPDGDIVWTEKIAKRQRTSNDQGFYSSYALAVKGDNLFFVFNDNVKNYFDNQQGEYFNGLAGGLKSSVVTMVTLDADGNKTKEVLFNTKDQEIIIRPKVCEQLNDDELVIFGQKKKTQKYAKVKL